MTNSTHDGMSAGPESSIDTALPINVPVEQLNSETVAELIESFILREGTDYGAIEASLETKKMQVEKQLARGEIKIVFDPNTETVTLLTDDHWKKLTRQIVKD